MRTTVFILVTFALAAVTQNCYGQAELDRDVSVPVHYEDQMMVVTTKSGTAVILFKWPVDDGAREGRHYQFRFLAPGGKEERGEGDVFEYCRRPPAGVSGPVVDLGSKLQIIAGKVKVTWSFGSSDCGWIYYVPEEMKIQFVGAASYEKISIARFEK